MATPPLTAPLYAVVAPPAMERLLPDDQAADDAIVRLSAAIGAVGRALESPAVEARPHALAAALALPATTQTALTRFAMEWLVCLAIHHPRGAAPDAVALAAQLLTDTSYLAPAPALVRAD